MAAIQHHPFTTLDALHDAAFALLERSMAVETERPNAIMLSGGNTPLPIYERIRTLPFRVAPKSRITYSDERFVPIDSPESNYGNTRPMLKALGLGEGAVIRVHTDQSHEEAAARFDQELADFLLAGGKISLAILGLGSDGHTCSLFTPEDLDKSAGRYAAAITRPAPPHRITVTPDLLTHVERVVFLVAGDDKAERARQLLEAPDSIVAGRAVAGCPWVELWQA